MSAAAALASVGIEFAGLTPDQTDELVRFLMVQGWHAENALILATTPDAPTKLALIRIADRARTRKAVR